MLPFPPFLNFTDFGLLDRYYKHWTRRKYCGPHSSSSCGRWINRRRSHLAKCEYCMFFCFILFLNLADFGFLDRDYRRARRKLCGSRSTSSCGRWICWSRSHLANWQECKYLCFFSFWTCLTFEFLDRYYQASRESCGTHFWSSFGCRIRRSRCQPEKR